MAKKTGRVTKNRKRTTPRDLRSTKAATVKGGAYAYDPVFLGGVQVASGDVNGDNARALKLAKLASLGAGRPGRPARTAAPTASTRQPDSWDTDASAHGRHR